MDKYIKIKGLNLHYDESGSDEGAPVILMHGWGCNLSTVNSIASILNREMKVYNIDLPGHGKSEEPEEVWGTDDFAEVINEFIKKLNIEKPSVIGHSFGGRTAIRLASMRSLNKLVLVDSAGIKPKRSLNYYIKVYSFKTFKKLIPLLLGKKKGEEAVERLRQKKGSADYSASSPRMRAIMSKCVNEDLKKYLPSVSCPTLLIWGKNDTATPISDAKIMEKTIPDCGLVAFDDSGHYSFLDNPGAFKAVCLEFFKNEINKIK